MEMLLKRKWITSKSTVGELWVDDKFFCYTLEDVVRYGEKVPGKTAIPAGTYIVRNTWSPKFSCMMPLVDKVPGFEGVRIHVGNTPEDTEGCILVGYMYDPFNSPDFIGKSKLAFGDLYRLLQLSGAARLEIVDNEKKIG